MTLDQLRRRIDRIDERLLRLLNQRAEYVLQIGRIKKKHRLPVYDGRREEELLRRLLRKNRGPLSSASVRWIFRQILQVSRQLQSPAVLSRKGRA